MLEAKPEIFIQTRYSVAPFDGSGTAFNPNIRLSRIETRWAGKINERLGAGIGIQFQESVEGSPEKLVNDAFLEYYLTDHATIRAGQVIKPFGFSVQQSSWIRESPERPMFSGYFFPGERDPGIMLSGDLGFLSGAASKDLQYFVGVKRAAGMIRSTPIPGSRSSGMLCVGSSRDRACGQAAAGDRRGSGR